RRQMHHLDDHRHCHVRVFQFADRLRAQRHQGRPQLLALSGQRILGISGDCRVKFPHLGRQPVRHRLQKRLHRFRYIFPRRNNFPVERFGIGNLNRAGFSRKHAVSTVRAGIGQVNPLSSRLLNAYLVQGITHYELLITDYASRSCFLHLTKFNTNNPAPIITRASQVASTRTVQSENRPISIGSLNANQPVSDSSRATSLNGPDGARTTTFNHSPWAISEGVTEISRPVFTSTSLRDSPGRPKSPATGTTR